MVKLGSSPPLELGASYGSGCREVPARRFAQPIIGGRPAATAACTGLALLRLEQAVSCSGGEDTVLAAGPARGWTLARRLATPASSASGDGKLRW